MIWNIITGDVCLQLWKKLRDEIEDLTVDGQLAKIAEFCSSMPIGSRTLDYHSPMNWPTPWEILYYNSFCTSSISLLIFYTLTLLPNDKTVELLLVEDLDGIYLLPLVNNQFVLNYHLGEVSKYSGINKDFEVLRKYSQEEVKKII